MNCVREDGYLFGACFIMFLHMTHTKVAGNYDNHMRISHTYVDTRTQREREGEIERERERESKRERDLFVCDIYVYTHVNIRIA